MSLLTEASLVILPNAVEEGTLFSIIPADGSGDMTAVRATPATLVNSEGIIEDCPYNLLNYSEQFDNASAWGLNNATITPNATTAPNGTLTADKICRVNNGSYFAINDNPKSYPGTIYTLSYYAKKAELDLTAVNLSVTGVIVEFNLTNGTVVTQSGANLISTNITPSVDGWYKCSITFRTPTSGNNLLYFIIAYQLTTGPIGGGYYLWGAQLVIGTEKEYFPTTDRLNVPRLDYTNGSCPSILVEPQRTNLLLRSEEFDNASWGKVNLTITANQTTAPDGNLTADLLAGIGTGASYSYQNATVVSGQTYTISIFAKKNQTKFLQIFGGLDFSVSKWANFDLENGIVGTTGVGTIASITPYDDGWYRCSIQTSNTSGTIGGSFFVPINSATASRNPSFNATNHSIYIWGAQLEAGSNATSYIPTVASTVTRNADVISKSGISSLIGQTEGAIFVDVNIKNYASDKRIIGIEANGIVWTQNNILIEALTNKSFSVQFVSNNIFSIISSATNQDVGRKKIIVSYNGTQYKFFINGVLIGTKNNTTPIMDKIQIGGLPTGGPSAVLNDSINSVLFFKNQLTDAECIDLTTL